MNRRSARSSKFFKKRPRSLTERCLGMIAMIQRKMANPDMREDCYHLAKLELAHWRKRLIGARMKRISV